MVSLSSNLVNVSSIAVGLVGVTSRNLYRTKASGTTYYLVVTIADNTTTTYQDNTADSSLSTVAPNADTSGTTTTIAGTLVADTITNPSTSSLNTVASLEISVCLHQEIILIVRVG